jgi:hypothetical protein
MPYLITPIVIDDIADVIIAQQQRPAKDMYEHLLFFYSCHKTNQSHSLFYFSYPNPIFNYASPPFWRTNTALSDLNGLHHISGGWDHLI